jgi:hypothetical protein
VSLVGASAPIVIRVHARVFSASNVLCCQNGLQEATMLNELVGPILNAIRTSGSEGRDLSTILKELGVWGRSGRIPNHTGAAIIGGAVQALLANGLIKISTNKKPDIEREILSEQFHLGFSYEAASILSKVGEKNVRIILSERFSQLQELFGFSLTDLIQDAGGKTLRVTPFFGRPEADPSLRSDVFVLMPFADELRPVYEDHIVQACKAANLSCQRADDFFKTGRIIDDVWSAIYQSNWIIADCTGRNPNVFYELGLAHTIGKRVILITQNEEDIPFDIGHIRYLKYEYTPRGMQQFEKRVTEILVNDHKN